MARGDPGGRVLLQPVGQLNTACKGDVDMTTSTFIVVDQGTQRVSNTIYAFRHRFELPNFLHPRELEDDEKRMFAYIGDDFRLALCVICGSETTSPFDPRAIACRDCDGLFCSRECFFRGMHKHKSHDCSKRTVHLFNMFVAIRPLAANDAERLMFAPTCKLIIPTPHVVQVFNRPWGTECHIIDLNAKKRFIVVISSVPKSGRKSGVGVSFDFRPISRHELYLLRMVDIENYHPDLAQMPIKEQRHLVWVYAPKGYDYLRRWRLGRALARLQKAASCRNMGLWLPPDRVHLRRMMQLVLQYHFRKVMMALQSQRILPPKAYCRLVFAKFRRCIAYAQDGFVQYGDWPSRPQHAIVGAWFGILVNKLATRHFDRSYIHHQRGRAIRWWRERQLQRQWGVLWVNRARRRAWTFHYANVNRVLRENCLRVAWRRLLVVHADANLASVQRTIARVGRQRYCFARFRSLLHAIGTPVHPQVLPIFGRRMFRYWRGVCSHRVQLPMLRSHCKALKSERCHLRQERDRLQRELELLVSSTRSEQQRLRNSELIAWNKAANAQIELSTTKAGMLRQNMRYKHSLLNMQARVSEQLGLID